jgi:hypothetical protein
MVVTQKVPPDEAISIAKQFQFAGELLAQRLMRRGRAKIEPSASLKDVNADEQLPNVGNWDDASDRRGVIPVAV